MQGLSQGARLLDAFIKVLADIDPQAIASSRAHEYEPEALSTLARFNEFHVGCLGDEAHGVVRAIVEETLGFWLPTEGRWRARVEEVAKRLLQAYLSEPADA